MKPSSSLATPRRGHFLVPGASGESVPWGYDGPCGPAHWGDLHPALATCKEGRRQSPVPLPSPGQAAVAGEVELPELIFEYRETRVFVSHLGCGLQFDCEPGSFLVLGGKRYELQQFHFHTPAEHTVAGVTAAMELHLVHRRSDDDFAVVGLLLHLADEDNPFVEKLWRKMPSEPLRFALETPLRADEALPDRRDYFHYRGSLTTPDCAEVVSWFVLEEQMSISRAQLDRYLERVGENARPLQPLNGRVILQGPAR